jgi:hypothetical protein
MEKCRLRQMPHPRFPASRRRGRSNARGASKDPVNLDRMLARWKLGQALAKIQRGTGPGRGKKMSQPETSFREFLRTVGVDKDVAHRAQRIGALPEAERQAAFEEARKRVALRPKRRGRGLKGSGDLPHRPTALS